MRKAVAALVAALLLMISAGCGRSATAGPVPPPSEIRLGYLANLTHAQALIGVADGRFAQATGTKVTTKIFDAGPAGITALLAGEIDLLYVGPSPAVNGYMRSGGTALKIIAGSASGGAVLVLRPGVDLKHLAGTHLASPGLGNTQDVALKNYLKQQGLKAADAAGAANSVWVTPMANADILNLFKQGKLDGAWVPEPWGARLEKEAGGQLALDERTLWPGGKMATTVLVSSGKFLKEHPETVQAFLREHIAITDWIAQHPNDARTKIQAELTRIQGRPLPDEEVTLALSRVDFTTDAMESSVRVQAQNAFDLGLLGDKAPDLAGLYDLSLLKGVSR